MKITKAELLAESYVDYPLDRYPAAMRDWELFDGYIEAQALGNGPHSTTEYLIVFERDGQLCGVLDTFHDEVGWGIDDMRDSDVVEFKPVKIVTVAQYEFV